MQVHTSRTPIASAKLCDKARRNASLTEGLALFTCTLTPPHEPMLKAMVHKKNDQREKKNEYKISTQVSFPKLRYTKTGLSSKTRINHISRATVDCTANALSCLKKCEDPKAPTLRQSTTSMFSRKRL